MWTEQQSGVLMRGREANKEKMYCIVKLGISTIADLAVLLFVIPAKKGFLYQLLAPRH